VAGSLSGWLIRDFDPIAMIPSGTRLTAFHSDDAKGSAGAAVLKRVVRNVEAGVYEPNLDRVFGLNDVAEAHRYMEDNQAAGKVVMLPGASRSGHLHGHQRRPDPRLSPRRSGTTGGQATT
jgi:NADPH:quinone reductase-like Zn-dependent oxidoreductase